MDKKYIIENLYDLKPCEIFPKKKIGSYACKNCENCKEYISNDDFHGRTDSIEVICKNNIICINSDSQEN